MKTTRQSLIKPLIALVIAGGVIAAISTFAAGGGNGQTAKCPDSVAKWASDHGWNASGYTCKPDRSAHTVDPLPGAMAAEEFKDIKNVKDLKAFLRSDSDKAEQVRSTAKLAMSLKSYKAWLSGDNFRMVQFNKAADIKGNSYVAGGGKVRYNDFHLRPVPAGDIVFVFVDPSTQNKVNGAGNIRLDSGNVRVAQVSPQEQKPGTLKIVSYDDANKNKTQDSGESRTASVSFFVRDIGIVTTDQNGEAELKNLAPGSYSVRRIHSAQTAGTIPTASNPQDAQVDSDATATVSVGNKKSNRTGRVKVVKFDDLNGNGVQDPGEPRLRGAQFRIGAGVGLVQTNAEGVVNVDELPVGEEVPVTEVPLPPEPSPTPTPAPNEPPAPNGNVPRDERGINMESGTVSSSKFSKQIQKYVKQGWICYATMYSNPQTKDDVLCAQKDNSKNGVGKGWSDRQAVVRDDSLTDFKGWICYRHIWKSKGELDSICGKPETFYGPPRLGTFLIVDPSKRVQFPPTAEPAEETPSEPADRRHRADRPRPGETQEPTTPVTQTATAAEQPTPVVFGSRARR